MNLPFSATVRERLSNRQEMRKQGFFLGFLETLLEFYEGVFKLTVFLPFTLLQAWHLSRNATYRQLQLTHGGGSGDDRDFIESQTERASKVSWDKDALPKHSILKNTRDQQSPHEDLATKLELIGREIELISDLLLRQENKHDKPVKAKEDSSQGLELELGVRSTSFQDLRNIFQHKTEAEADRQDNPDNKESPDSPDSESGEF